MALHRFLILVHQTHPTETLNQFVIYSNRKTHPRALFVLFFAEMWERFSYYGMRALLTLYMVKVLFEGQEGAETTALGIYGSYTAMVYLFPVIGGLIADRIFGFRKAVVWGGFMMMLGHFALAMEGLVFPGNLNLFFGSLALIIVGNGYFKPNISSFLGKFYDKNDPRKDGAFTIFYMGVNIGAFLSTLTCGYVGEAIGWHYGFGLAGIGMAIGLIVFMLSGKIFEGKGLEPNPAYSRKPLFAGLTPNMLVYAGSLLFVPIVALFLDLDSVLTIGLTIASIGFLIFFFIMGLRMVQQGDTPSDEIDEVASSPLGAKIDEIGDTPATAPAIAPVTKKIEGQRLWVVGVLFLFHAVFWALFEQAGGSLTLFTEKVVDRMVGGTEIQTSLFQSLNPFYIMILAPLFSWIWLKLNQAKREPSTPMKFVLGLAQLALGFAIIVLGARLFLTEEGKIPLIFLVLMYLFHTTGELSLSPVGLSMITKLSPSKIVGFVMGAWFLSIALANKMAGEIGKLSSTEGPEAETLSNSAIVEIYSGTYLTWGVFVVLGAALLLLLLVPTLRKWMNGIH